MFRWWYTWHYSKTQVPLSMKKIRVLPSLDRGSNPRGSTKSKAIPVNGWLLFCSALGAHPAGWLLAKMIHRIISLRSAPLAAPL